MPSQVIICDDSSFARKQVFRALPAGFQTQVLYAENGQEALEIIRSGQADLMFLDLTMPILDGFGVLEVVRKEDLNCMIIVVSGDIQPAAKDRVMKLGALGFIKKPVRADDILRILTSFGLIEHD